MESRKIREIVKSAIVDSYVGIGTKLTVVDNNAIRVITERALELFNSEISRLSTNIEDLERTLAAQPKKVSRVAYTESLAEVENLREQLKQQTEAREELVDKLTNAASLITKLQGASKEEQLIEQVADLKVELEEKDRVRRELKREATDKIESVEKQLDKFKGNFYRALGYIDRVNEGKHPTPNTHGYGGG